MNIAVKSHKRRSLRGIIKSVDMYGHPINLSYKNSPEYKSVFGGILTLMFRILVILFFSYKILQLFQRKSLIK